MDKRPIAILGAAGGTGRPLVAELERRGRAVRAIVGRPEQAAGFSDARVARLEDAVQIADAIEGAAAVHLIPPVFNASEPSYAANAIAAAQAVEVSRFSYHSVLHAPTPAMPHHRRKSEVELLLRESPLAWTILQPAMYAQTAFTFLDRAAARFACPFGLDRPFNPIDLADLTEAVANILCDDGHDCATYELAGAERLTPAEMAAQIGDALGVGLDTQVADPGPVAAARAARRGFDARQTQELLAMYRHYDGHGLAGNGNV
jgi:NAD(P)H dehydrogenase (quinone)